MRYTDYLLEHWVMTDFGKNLAELRKLRQLTQLELANMLEVQPRLIGRWERGQGKPQFDYIIRLSEVLEVSFDRLLQGQNLEDQDQFDIKNKKLKELCRQIDSLRPEDQDVVCHFLDMAVKQDQLKKLVGKQI
ncbi:helix-turn-helix transcriptional regulator [Pseudoalteromonas sp. MMG022]|uniref:helix-turn-helix domain-containing protein n=1 Tax=Pseudoalteromonas sp. MMG022 TaxID=2909978 RepID=UPI001F22386F|nr:helix-turn-helix transcriptional regulator [Pseudoalteromonas sp. MMG022]MCF6437004.1 helix-turn-helix domain-containing protein [Pseudoalteromonas sp. MMG022]